MYSMFEKKNNQFKIFWSLPDFAWGRSRYSNGQALSQRSIELQQTVNLFDLCSSTQTRAIDCLPI